VENKNIIQLSKEEMSLSEDARRVGAAWFGMMAPKEGQLVFSMERNRPTKRAQAALDELLTAGMISCESFNKYGGIIYRPIWDFRKLGTKYMLAVLNGETGDPLSLIEPINP